MADFGRQGSQWRDWLGSIPGYKGYKDKEARRDSDKVLRMSLAAKYQEQRQRLVQLEQDLVAAKQLALIEQVDQAAMKLQRLVDRLKTATYGYAGLFDAVTVQELELSQLYAFDKSLASGVSEVAQRIDALAAAVASAGEAAGASRELSRAIEELNLRFDRRQTLLNEGGRQVLTDPLAVLKEKPKDAVAASQGIDLHFNDAVTLNGIDYLTTGKISYKDDTGQWSEFLLRDGSREIWLEVRGQFPSQTLSAYEAIDPGVSAPPPSTLSYDNEPFVQRGHHSGLATIAGPSGESRGVSVESWEYDSPSGRRLRVRDWGGEIKSQLGKTIDVKDLQIWTR